MASTPPARLLATVFGAIGAVACVALTWSCTTVDLGPNFVVPDEQFDADFFFCVVEPQLLFAKKCGSGDPGLGDGTNSCHFNSSAVSGMVLNDHAPVACTDNHPTTRVQIGAGSGAQGNLESASLEMSRDYKTAPIFIRPTSPRFHPRQIFPPDDPVADVIRQWAAK